MPSFDERLRRALEGLAHPADPAGALDRIAERKQALPRTRRVQALTIAVVVLGATTGAGYGLYRAFGIDRPPPVSQEPELTEPTGRIAFARLRPNKPEASEGAIDWVTAAPDGSALAKVTDESYLYSVGADWSPDGTKLIYDEGISEGESAIVVINADGSGRHVLDSIPTEFTPYQPAWSPDGGAIAFATGNAPAEIYLIDLATRAVSPLTNDDHCNHLRPSWSPDGAQIAFVASCENRSEVRVVAVAGGQPERVAAGQDVDWSPDGRYLAIARGDQLWQIYRHELASGEEVQLTHVGDNGPLAWSPDGNWIAFESSRQLGMGGIYVVRSDGSEERLVAEEGSAPSWGPSPSPDSSPLQPTPLTSTVYLDPPLNRSSFSPPGDAEPKLTPAEAVEAFTARNPDFAGVPDDGKAYLGFYTADTGGGTFRFKHRLAWGITWHRCTDGWAAVPGHTPSPVPVSCTFWLFLDANTGWMLEATWQ